MNVVVTDRVVDLVPGLRVRDDENDSVGSPVGCWEYVGVPRESVTENVFVNETSYVAECESVGVPERV